MAGSMLLIKCLRLTDVDDAGSVPFVKVLCKDSQESKTSGPSVKAKKSVDYGFDGESGHLVFVIPPKDTLSFAVNIICKNPVSTILPGVGEFTIGGLSALALGIGKASARQCCTMYEDDLPYGDLHFTYEIINEYVQEPAATPAAAAAAAAAATTTATAATSKVAEGKGTAAASSVAVSAPVSSAAAPVQPSLTADSGVDDGGDLTGGGQRKVRKIKPPEWTKSLVPYAPAPSDDGASVRDIKTLEGALRGGGLMIRVHSLVVTMTERAPSSPLQSRDLTSAVKLSLQPAPGKPIILRSRAASDPSTEGLPLGRGSKLAFDFERKTAVLNMAAGDLRSRMFREGNCARLQLDVSAAGANFSGSIYLPTLMSAHAGEALVVPMLLSDVSETPMVASLAIEAFNLGTESSGMGLLADSANPGVAASPDQLIKAHQALADRTFPGCCRITCDFLGVMGYSGIPDGLRLEARLSGSAAVTQVQLDRSLSFGTGFAQKGSLTLVSLCPSLDVLELRLCKGLSPDDELGRAMFAVSAFDCTAANPNGSPTDVRAFRSFVSDSTDSARAGEWSLVGSLAAAAFKPSVYNAPVPPLAAAAVQQPPSPIRASGTAWTDSQVSSAALALGDQTSAVTLLSAAPVVRDTTPAISGTLACCVQGFLLRAGRYSLGSSDELSADVTLMPEGLRKAVGGSKAASGELRGSNPRSFGPGNDLAASVEWAQGRSFSMPLAWSMQQRQVSYLKLGLQVSRGGKDKPATIGAAALDLSSLVATSYQAVTILLPVRDGALGGNAAAAAAAAAPAASASAPADAGITTVGGTGVVQDQDVFGWVLLSVQFTPGRAITSDAGSSDMETSCAAMWNKVLAGNLSLSSLALSSVGGVSGAGTLLSPTAAVASAAAALPPNVVPLQVVLKWPLEIAAATANAILKEGETIVMQLRFGSDAGLSPHSVIDLSTSVAGNQLIFDKKMAVLAAPCSDELDRSLSYILFLYLLRVNATTKISRVIAESAVVVPKEILHHGMPFEMSIPTRSKDGAKVCVVHASLHSSSMHSIEGPEVGPETVGSPIEMVHVAVRCEEGNVRDPSWRSPIEPFFEVTLMPPPALANDRGVQASKLQDRTQFLSPKVLTDENNKWGLGCRLTLAASTLPQSPSEESSLAKWLVAIVCRDASRYGCPEIAWARVGIPWGLLLRNEGIDQWIQFSPSRPAPSVGSEAGAVAGRVKVRIFRMNPPADGGCVEEPMRLKSLVPAATCNGIGSIAVWLKSLIEIRAGNEEARQPMSSSTATCLLNKTSTEGVNIDPLGLDEASKLPFAEAFVADGSHGTAVMVQAVPVPGGEAELRLRVSTSSSKTVYVATLPVLAGISAPPPPDDIRGPSLSTLELLLTDELNAGSGAGGKRPTARRPPRLCLDASYIPFVKGFLTVSLSNIQLDPVITGKYVPGIARRAVLRAVLGPDAYAYSDPFDLNDLAPAAKSSKLKAKPVTSISLTVDTLVACQGPNGAMSLTMSLIDLDSASEAGSPYCLGSSVLQTAPLYYQATRAAASSSASATSSSTGGLQAVGTSPTTTLDLDMVDSVSRRSVGNMTVSAQFVMTGPSDGVLAAIESSTNPPAKDAPGSTTELTLKQSFKAADADNSGNISSQELVTAMVNARAKRGPGGRGTSVPRGAASAASALGATNAGGGEPDEAYDMLLSLAGPGAAATVGDSKNMNEIVAMVFGRLDVDGDGSISWWEWKRVLTFSLLGRSPSAVYCNPRDVLCVGLAAACDAVRASSAPALLTSIPFVRVNIKQGGDGGGAVPSDLDALALDDLPLDLPLAKAVPRLQNLVKSLRVTNNTLQQRLEKAIIESQTLAQRQNSFQVSAPAAADTIDASAATLLKQEITQAKQRALDAESQQQMVLKTLEYERARGQQLEAELNRIKRNNEVATSAMASAASAKAAAAEKLKKEIEAHNVKLADVQKKKQRRMQSLMLLAMWLRRKVLPYVRKVIRERVKSQLSHHLSGMVARKKYVTEKKARAEAATKLQGGFRGFKGRKKVTNMQASATKIQAVFRGNLARDLRRKIVLQKVAAAFSSKYRAGSIVKRALLRWLAIQQAVKDAAATKLQALQRSKMARKDVDKRRIEAAKEREARDKQAAAAKVLELSALNEWQNFQKVKLSLVPAVDRPHCKDTVGYWLTLKMPDGLSETEAGLVVACNADFRLVTVLFNDGTSHSKANDKQRELPFDHPKLKWYVDPEKLAALATLKASSPVKSVMPGTPAFAASTPGDASDDDDDDGKITEASSIELEEVPRPDLKDVDKGFLVSFHADDDADDEARVGQVKGKDIKKRIIMVAFADDQDPSSPRMETLPYEHPNITWFSDRLYMEKQRLHSSRKIAKELSKVPRPPLAKAVGYKVEVVSKDPDAAVGDMFLGCVVSIDRAAMTIRIEFEAEEGEEADHEDMPYLSRDIAWMEAPVLVPTFDLSFVKKPALKDCIGYQVECRADLDDAEHDDMYVGIVSDFDEKANTFTVAFEVDEPDGSIGHDHEVFPYGTTHVAWMAEPVPTSSVKPLTRTVRQTNVRRQRVPRPEYGPGIVGHLVDVLVHDNVDDDKDVYGPARVVGLNEKRKSIAIQLEEDTDDGVDFLTMAWKSKDVFWVKTVSEVVSVTLPIDAPAPAGVAEGLKAAATKGDVSAVTELVAEWEWADDVLNWSDPKDSGKTGLQCACERGHAAVVKAFISAKDKGLDLNRTDVNGSGAMNWACAAGAHKCVQVLLEAAADDASFDVNLANSNSETGLIAATVANAVEVVKLLLAHPRIEVNRAQKDGRTALVLACLKPEKEAIAIAALLLGHPAIDANLPVSPSLPDLSALSVACAKGNVEAVRLLLAHKSIKVTAAALHAACAKDFVEIVKLLLDFASPSAEKAEQGGLRGSEAEAAKQVPASANSTASPSPSPAAAAAAAAASSSGLNLVINKRNAQGLSPLAIAVKENSLGVLRFLTSKPTPGLDLSAVDFSGLLQLASSVEARGILSAAEARWKPAPEAKVEPKPEPVPSAVVAPQVKVETAPTPASAPTPAPAPVLSPPVKYPWQAGQPVKATPLQPGDGIDVYIDCGQMLPDNATITRVCLKMFSANKTPLGQTFDAESVVDSVCSWPTYGLRAQLRLGAGDMQGTDRTSATAAASVSEAGTHLQADWDPTQMCMIRIDTIDSFTGQAAVLGYCCFGLFETAVADGSQPKALIKGAAEAPAATSSSVLLIEGGQQLPVHHHFIPPQPQFTASMLSSVPKVPCASVLIRVLRVSAASIAAAASMPIPAQPAPAYQSGFYDGRACQPRPADEVCFRTRQLASIRTLKPATAPAPLQTVGQALALLAAREKTAKASLAGSAASGLKNSKSVVSSSPRDPPPLANAESLVVSSLPITAEMKKMIDYARMVPYSPEAGILASIDMLVNLPDVAGGMFSSAKALLYRVTMAVSPSPSPLSPAGATTGPCEVDWFYGPASTSVVAGADAETETASSAWARLSPTLAPSSLSTDGSSHARAPVFLSPGLSAVSVPRTDKGTQSAMGPQSCLVLDVRAVRVSPEVPVTATASAKSGGLFGSSKKAAASAAAEVAVSVGGVTATVEESPEFRFWTLLPLATEIAPGAGAGAGAGANGTNAVYLASGTFLLPLVQGPVPRSAAFWASPKQALVEALARGHSGQKSTRSSSSSSNSNSNSNSSPARGAAIATAATDPPLSMMLSSGCAAIVRVVNPVAADCLLQQTAPAIRPHQPIALNTEWMKELVHAAADATGGSNIPREDLFSFDPARYPGVDAGCPKSASVDGLLSAGTSAASKAAGGAPVTVTAQSAAGAVNAAVTAVLKAELEALWAAAAPVSTPAALAPAVKTAAPTSASASAATASPAPAAAALVTPTKPAADVNKQATVAAAGGGGGGGGGVVVAKPAAPAAPTEATTPGEIKTKQVPRPALGPACLGHLIEVPAAVLDPSADKNDFLPMGRVRSVDAAKRKLVVQFETDPGEPEDIEELQYDEPRLEWVVQA